MVQSRGRRLNEALGRSLTARLFGGEWTASTANTTNTVALCPGYFGGVLLLRTNEQMFRTLVPWLLLVASLLLAVQGRVRAWVAKRRQPGAPRRTGEAWVALPVFVAAIYGGYFGAGLGVVLLATLALALDDTLARLNALKQAISLAVNVAAGLVAAAWYFVKPRRRTAPLPN